MVNAIENLFKINVVLKDVIRHLEWDSKTTKGVRNYISEGNVSAKWGVTGARGSLKDSGQPNARKQTKTFVPALQL